MNKETEIILEVVTTRWGSKLRQELRELYAKSSLTSREQQEDIGLALSIAITEDLMQHPMPHYAAKLIVEQFKRVDWKLVGQRILVNVEAN